MRLISEKFCKPGRDRDERAYEILLPVKEVETVDQYSFGEIIE
jgi:hypothetical protein